MWVQEQRQREQLRDAHISLGERGNGSAQRVTDRLSEVVRFRTEKVEPTGPADGLDVGKEDWVSLYCWTLGCFDIVTAPPFT